MALPEESTRFRRQRAELAINLAMQSRWEEAVTANQSILGIFPTDVDAFNRLGKAYTELGRYHEAREAYHKALEIDPTNSIAKRNIARLAGLKSAPRTTGAVATRMDPRIFIAETGKTGVVALQNVAKDVQARVTAGDQVLLKVQDKLIYVTTLDGEYLGQVEPRVGLRLVGLMNGGNRYEAALTSVSEQQTKAIIREVYQSPALVGRLSFPSRPETGFRPYIKESILQYGLEDEAYSAEDEETSDWEEEEPQDDNTFIAQSLPVERDEDDEEEEET